MKEFAPFRLDPINHSLLRRTQAGDFERVVLAPKAFDLLRYLVDHAGRLITHRELLRALWPTICVDGDAVKQHVFEVRRVLGDSSKQPRYIETMSRRGYRFIAPVSDDRAFPMNLPPSGRAGPLVGRKTVLEQLQNCLRRAMRGDRQIVFVTGEPGIGKTAMVDEFQRQAAAEDEHLRIGRGQCVEGYGGKEAYYPMLEALAQLSRGKAGDAVVQTLAAPAPTWLVQFPALMSREHRETLQYEMVGGTRARMLREISEALEAITVETPLLLVFEDLQWADHPTVDLVSALARRRAPAKLLLIATKRSVGIECDDDHPLKSVKHELLMHGLCREISLEPLAESEVAEYLAAQPWGTELPRELPAIVRRHCGGNPLFMVAALEHMTKRGLIVRGTGKWELRAPLEEIDLQVPANLGQMIEARIVRLSQEEQRVLEAASITGTTFSPGVNAAGTDLGVDAFEELCGRLSRRHGILRSIGAQHFPDAGYSSRYEFAHALYREVLYLRQAPGRRATLHRRIGERLEALFAERLNEIAPELACHFEEGFDYARAARYQRLAAESATRRDAPIEAAARLQRALELMGRLGRNLQAGDHGTANKPSTDLSAEHMARRLIASHL